MSHESHFYPSRAQFVPQMVNSLSRLGLLSSSPAENRALSVDLVELVLRWEKRARGVSPSPRETTRRRTRTRTRTRRTRTKTKTTRRRRRNASGPSGRAATRAPPTKKPRRRRSLRPSAVVPAAAPPRRRRRMRRRMIRKTPSCPPPRRRTRTWRWATRTTSTWATPPTRTPRTEGAANAEVKAPPDADDFAPTPGMREIMVNFLVRMSFLTGESKDKQMLALHARSLSLLREALATWPSANIKFAFIEKLLASAAAAGGDAANTLRTGLAVFNVALDADAERSSPGTRRSSRRCSSRASTAAPGRRTRRSPTRSRAPLPYAAAPGRGARRARRAPPRDQAAAAPAGRALCQARRRRRRRRGGRRRHPQRADPGHERGVRADVHLRARGARARWTATFRTSSSCCPGSRTS